METCKCKALKTVDVFDPGKSLQDVEMMKAAKVESVEIDAKPDTGNEEENQINNGNDDEDEWREVTKTNNGFLPFLSTLCLLFHPVHGASCEYSTQNFTRN